MSNTAGVLSGILCEYMDSPPYLSKRKKRQRKVKGHSRIDNPERHMHYWSQDTERRQIKQKTQHRIQ
jgi:hypothetical protein